MYRAALRHSTDMSTVGFCGHYGSDGSDPFVRLRDAGYTRYRWAGENVASGSSLSLSVAMTLWMGSPGHCMNIMAPEYSEFALAEVNGAWTMVFGDPL
jgi:uncharacterized protein YkwD